MGGFGWAPSCTVCWTQKNKHVPGGHMHEEKSYCEKHYLMEVQNLAECPGCVGSGWSLPHGKPDPSGKIKCNLCKGKGAIEAL
jgi:hypothetical protein